MKKKRIKIILIILLVIVAGLWLLSPSKDTGNMYRTDTVKRGTIAQVVSTSGTLNPVQIVNVGTQVSGQVSALYVKLNDEVKKDQLLAEIDPKLVESALKQSTASLEISRLNFEQASRDLERTKTLVAKDYVAKVDLERSTQAYLSSRNSYESAKAQVERDKLNVGYTRITSPIDGVVISQDITLGQTVQASFQTPNMFKIAGSLTEMKIDVNLSEADIAQVKEGQSVTFTVDAFQGKEFKGRVGSVNLNPKQDQGVVTYSTQVLVENNDKLLFPGMTAYVTITQSEKKDVLKVPAAALRFNPPRERKTGLAQLFGVRTPPMNAGNGRPDGQGIYLLKNGEAELVPVQTGTSDDSYVEIISDQVKEGDTVIIGMNLLADPG